MEKLYKIVYYVAAVNLFSAILGKLFATLKIEWAIYVVITLLGVSFLCLLVDYIYSIIKYKNIDHVFFCFSALLLLLLDVGYLNKICSMSYNLRLALLICNIVICVGLILYSYLHYKKEGKASGDRTILPFVQNQRENFLILMYITSIFLYILVL